MTFWHAIYLVLVYPLELIFEIVFSVASKHVSNYGFAIIWLSLIVNLLTLPLYLRADRISNEQNELEKKHGPGIKHIKKTFKGDEQAFILQAYYKFNNYSPLLALRSATSVLLQIPFFMAAYNMLSGLICIDGVSFWFIKDLGAPDALFSIGGFNINILPILMTLINVVSGLIYTRGHSVREKVQVNTMAALFLILLYNSPAGLAFYWTLNNVFSLCKNIVTFLIGVIIKKTGILKSITSMRAKVGNLINRIPDSNRSTLFIFLIAELILTFLIGIVVPATLISDAPIEFLDPVLFDNPSKYIWNSGLIAAGFFICWCSIIYWFLTPKLRSAFTSLTVGTAIMMMLDFFYFQDILATLPQTIYIKLLYVVVVIVICAAIAFLHKFSKFILNAIYVTILVGLFALSFVFIGRINTTYNAFNGPDTSKPIEISLSKEGNNVLVIMLDRSIGDLLEDEFSMIPGIAEQYKGFTFYPNTISYGAHTNIATPSLFGGYEYTPLKMNERDNELLEYKQNEALKMLPRLFSESGYDVTVIDPPYAGYEFIPELNIYDDLENVNAYFTASALTDNSEELNAELTHSRERDFVLYGFCSCIVFGQDFLYDQGNYNNPNRTVINDLKFGSYNDINGELYKAVDHYYVLKNLTSITKITDSSDGSLLVFQNSLPHDEIIPIYDMLDVNFDLDQYSAQYNAKYPNNVLVTSEYLSSGVALSLLGDWFDYLRAEGVYDNTRIIIVSDHGYPHYLKENQQLPDGFATERYNPILFYKDFGSDDDFSINNEFMTNADTPYLAVDGIIDNPVNPYTGKPITNDAKFNEPVYLCNSHKHSPAYNNGTAFDNDTGWYKLADTTGSNVFDNSNWIYMDEVN